MARTIFYRWFILDHDIDLQLRTSTSGGNTKINNKTMSWKSLNWRTIQRASN